MSIRRLFRDILVYGSGDVVLRATAVLTLPIYSRLFGPGEYGLWSFLVTLTFFLNAFLLLGGDAAYARYFFAGADRRAQQVLTSTTVILLAAAGTIVTLVLLPLAWMFSDWSFGTRGHGDLVALALVSGPVVVLNTILGQALRNQFRAGMFALLNAGTAVAGVALSLYLIVARDLGVKGVLIGGLAAAVLVLPIRLWTVRDLLQPTFSWPVCRRLLAFGLPLVPAAVAGWAMSVSDRLVLGKLSTLHEVGLYSVAASVVSLITFLNSPLGQAWSPHAVQAYERDEEAARAFYGRVLTYILLGFGLLAVVVTAFGRELLRLLATPEFGGARLAIAPLALAAVAYATIQVTSAGISLRHRTVYIALVSVAGALLNLALNVAFVPRWGMQASAWATAVSSLFLTGAYAAISRRLWRVSYENRRVAAASVATIGFTMGAHLMPPLTLVAAMPLKLAYCVAYLGALVSLGAIDRRETTAARTALAGLPVLRPRRS